MQAIKEKINDMRFIHKAKADARAEEEEVKERTRAEEKAEKELAKARVEVAHEMRKAKEAEAEMQLHAAKAGQRAQEEISKYTSSKQTQPPNATVAGAAAGANFQ